MMVKRFAACLALVVVCAAASLAGAGEADIVSVKAVKTAAGAWRFDVTVRHADAGWDHYADAWDIVAPDGRVLGQRVLLHPHEAEQPFTRSLDNVSIPSDIGRVTVRARDKVHGYGGRTVTVDLPQ